MTGPADVRSASAPWYRHFWPWFIVTLLSASVFASLATVVIAYRHADSLVRDDYYQDGLAVNRRFESERAAWRQRVSAQLHFDAGGRQLALELEGRVPDDLDRLALDLSHATQADRDRRVILVRVSPGHFHAELSDALTGHFYATLSPADRAGVAAASEPAWRLSRSLVLPAAGDLVFGAERP